MGNKHDGATWGTREMRVLRAVRRQQDSARVNAVKLFDGVGDGVKARLRGRVAKMV
jgi:hypothetical protein